MVQEEQKPRNKFSSGRDLKEEQKPRNKFSPGRDLNSLPLGFIVEHANHRATESTVAIMVVKQSVMATMNK